MFECGDLDAVASAHLDGELDPARESELVFHLTGCAICRERLEVERAYDAALRLRLRRTEVAPASLHAAVRGAIVAARPPSVAWYARGLASSWAPRFAMAAVLAVLLIVPAVRLLQRIPDVAQAAGDRHGCHHLTAGGVVPPCCKELSVLAGMSLDDPSAGVVVPDLTSAGLRLVRATRCNFHQADANLLAYHDVAGNSFSLVLSPYEPASSRLIRWRREDGVPVARYVVPVDVPAHGVRERLDVTLWRSGKIACAWTGPEGNTAHPIAWRVLRQSLR